MAIALAVAAAVVVLALVAAMAVRLLRAQREAHVRAYKFPPGLFDAFAQRRPGPTRKDRQLVARALRQFFLAYLKGGRRFVSMPSQAADDLWHEFILYTKHYHAFCGKASGVFSASLAGRHARAGPPGQCGPAPRLVARMPRREHQSAPPHADDAVEAPPRIAALPFPRIVR